MRTRLFGIRQIERGGRGRFGFEWKIDEGGVILGAAERPELQEVFARLRQHDPFPVARPDQISGFERDSSFRCHVRHQPFPLVVKAPGPNTQAYRPTMSGQDDRSAGKRTTV